MGQWTGQAKSPRALIGSGPTCADRTGTRSRKPITHMRVA